MNCSKELLTPTPSADTLLRYHHLEKGIASSAGLSVEEFHCLTQLYVHKPGCVKDLSALLDVAPSRTSKLLRVLEDRGFIVRSLGSPDRRKERVELTDIGKAAAQDLVQKLGLQADELSAAST